MKQDHSHFSDNAMATAAAIVRVFETGSALGNYSAVAVLNDGAGVSYGISQFTHRSGSLQAVVKHYLAIGGAVGRRVFEAKLPILRRRSAAAISLLASNVSFKKALRAAGFTREMRVAQDAAAFERYMLPAITACAGSGFVLPLSLAVVYDSMTHGSYHKIRDRVRIRNGGAALFEKVWITEYVRQRDAWLGSIPRLRATRYRTRFFLNQIALGKWELELPLNVHGVRLTNELLGISPATEGEYEMAAGPYSIPEEHHIAIEPPNSSYHPADTPQARPPFAPNAGFGPALGDGVPTFDSIESSLNQAGARFDRVERIAIDVANRTDRAKSLWTTIVGTSWQAGWAILGFLAGMPSHVWLAVAVIAAVLTLAYLYRQITLGKIRESLEYRL
jgi:hypothetical protein